MFCSLRRWRFGLTPVWKPVKLSCAVWPGKMLYRSGDMTTFCQWLIHDEEMWSKWPREDSAAFRSVFASSANRANRYCILSFLFFLLYCCWHCFSKMPLLSFPFVKLSTLLQRKHKRISSLLSKMETTHALLLLCHTRKPWDPAGWSGGNG